MRRLIFLFPLLLGAAAEETADKPPADDADKTPAVKAPTEKISEEEPKSRRPAAPPEVFEQALGDYYADEYVSAASAMYDYIATNEATVENYEWAEYFLGVSLYRLGFRHGGTEYLYNVAKNRSRPEILPDALARLEEAFDEPHDERLLDAQLVVEGDFGYLPPYVSGFVFYHQGLADLRAKRLVWAERLFDEIPEDSKYFARSLYALGVQRLTKNRQTDAVKFFRRALAHPASDRKLRNEARLALARVLYEKEEYRAALAMYDLVEVPELSIAEASLYLEKAWTSYWLGDYRKTMGILYALEAPSYRDYFAPEKYLLRALVYKDLCHYIPAKREIRRFRFRYQETLDNIRERIDLREDDRLRTAALSRGRLGRLAGFRRQIADEADRIDTIGGSWVEVGLDDHLRGVYALKAEQTDLRLEAMLRRATRNIAEELVEFEEQMYLLDYEIGLAIYRRLKKEDARRPTEADDLSIPLAGDAVYYEFDEEFWNDELPDYDFFVENRCFDEGARD